MLYTTKDRVLKLNQKYEYVIVIVLLLTLMIVVAFGAVSLLIMIALATIEKFQTTDLSDLKFTMPLLHEVFNGFLMILIGLELIKTVVMYLDDHLVHVEVVLSVAMIAIARHVVEMDLNTAPALNRLGTGSVIIALAAAYYYFKKAGIMEKEANTATEKET